MSLTALFMFVGICIAALASPRPAIMAAYALAFDRARGALLGRVGIGRINKVCAVRLAGAAGLLAT